MFVEYGIWRCCCCCCFLFPCMHVIICTRIYAFQQRHEMPSNVFTLQQGNIVNGALASLSRLLPHLMSMSMIIRWFYCHAKFHGGRCARFRGQMQCNEISLYHFLKTTMKWEISALTWNYFRFADEAQCSSNNAAAAAERAIRFFFFWWAHFV